MSGYVALAVAAFLVLMMLGFVAYQDGRCAGTCEANGYAYAERNHGCWCRTTETASTAVRVYR